MTSPPVIKEVFDDVAWAKLCADWTERSEPKSIFVVYSPSAIGHVARIFPALTNANSWQIAHEPTLDDFVRFEGIRSFRPGLVIGIGAGRTLDAAKIIAHWGHTYSTTSELQLLIKTGKRIMSATRANLLLAPTLASSGSESSRGAIITIDSVKSGLRGESMQADLVVHDPRLWGGIPAPLRVHYAYDIFAHLLETTVSLSRTALSAAQAAEGAAQLWHWLFECGASDKGYQHAMQAAYHAGACLANSATCLPHRIQYVIGPHTGTNHVEGIWMLSPPWVTGLLASAPARADEVLGILQGHTYGYTTLDGLFGAVHALGGCGVRHERFDWSLAEACAMAERVSGDLSADPSFVNTSTILNLLLATRHD